MGHSALVSLLIQLCDYSVVDAGLNGVDIASVVVGLCPDICSGELLVLLPVPCPRQYTRPNLAVETLCPVRPLV